MDNSWFRLEPVFKFLPERLRPVFAILLLFAILMLLIAEADNRFGGKLLNFVDRLLSGSGSAQSHQDNVIFVDRRLDGTVCEKCPVMSVVSAMDLPPFAMSLHVISVSEYRAFIDHRQQGADEVVQYTDCYGADDTRQPEANWYKHKNNKLPDDARLGCITWDDAMHYIKWLRNVTGKPYRLPTAVEWMAARPVLLGKDGLKHGQSEWVAGCAEPDTPSHACSLRPTQSLTLDGRNVVGIDIAGGSRNTELGFRVIRSLEGKP